MTQITRALDQRIKLSDLGFNLLRRHHHQRTLRKPMLAAHAGSTIRQNCATSCGEA
jgi:hypothetical protein